MARTRITCRQSDHGEPDGSTRYYANVWGPRPGPWQGRPQLGHGTGATRAEAIRNAKADARTRGAL